MERLDFHFSLSCIEGNGNPLQCSCLENPRDGGAWWAPVYRVAQSQTRLKWLSSSSSSMHIHTFFSNLLFSYGWLNRAAMLYELVAQLVNCLSAMQETQVQSLGWEDPLKKGMATHSSTLAWKIPWTAEPGGLQSMGAKRVEQVWATPLSLSCYTSGPCSSPILHGIVCNHQPQTPSTSLRPPPLSSGVSVLCVEQSVSVL